MIPDREPLWLRHGLASPRSGAPAGLLVSGDSATLSIAQRELRTTCSSIFGNSLPILKALVPDALVAGTAATLPDAIETSLAGKLDELGSEGFVIRSLVAGGMRATVIASAGEIGALYGSFHFLRLLQTG